MKNFCKKFCVLYFLGLVLFLAGCGDEPDKEFILYPDSGLAFGLFPNDYAKNDSSAANLAHGITLIVHPNATYQLSFDVDPNFEAPKLQLFRIFMSDNGEDLHAQPVRTLDPVVKNGRYIYSFVCEERENALWATSLIQNNTYYEGRVSNIRFTGEGAYSDHFSINLILVGNIEDELEEFTAKELATNLLAEYRKLYTSVTIDTLYINRAAEHPTLGKTYPANEPWIAGRSSDDIMVSELGGWPVLENALDITLVHFIDQEGILGYSNLFSANLGKGLGSTVVLGTHIKTPAGEEALDMQGIIETALHETGHFFGLRHTTATRADIETIFDDYDFGDYSNLEDGLEDTPSCNSLVATSLTKVQRTDFRINRLMPRIRIFANSSFKIEDCPDAGNYMFPLTVENKTLSFSKQQLAIIRQNLMIFPH